MRTRMSFTCDFSLGFTCQLQLQTPQRPPKVEPVQSNHLFPLSFSLWLCWRLSSASTSTSASAHDTADNAAQAMIEYNAGPDVIVVLKLCYVCVLLCCVALWPQTTSEWIVREESQKKRYCLLCSCFGSSLAIQLFGCLTMRT